MPKTGPYHHGDLRQALLDAAVAAVAEHGPANLSLRDLARRAGVSHAAPAHHFGDKAGMLTAVAAEGYELLADALDAAGEAGDYATVGSAYVRFAVENRAHFDVMFRPELYDAEDPAVLAASERAAAALYGGAAGLPPGQAGSDVKLAGVAAWSLMHGFATLWLNGALPEDLGGDPVSAAQAVARVLFRG